MMNAKNDKSGIMSIRVVFSVILVLISFVLPTFMTVYLGVFTFKEIIDDLLVDSIFEGLFNSVPFILFSVYLFTRDYKLSEFKYGLIFRFLFYGYAFAFSLLSIKMIYSYNISLDEPGASTSALIFPVYAFFSVSIFVLFWFLMLKKES